MSTSKCQRYVFRDGICVLRGDIKKYDFAGCPPNTEVAIVRSKEVNTITLKQGNRYVQYCITIPELTLSMENVWDSLEYYKQALKKAKEMGFKEVAVEAISFENDDDLVAAFSLISTIRESIGVTIGIKPMKVYILCPEWSVYESYLRAVGENVGCIFSVSNELKSNQAILIPTEKKMSNFENHFAAVKKYEPFGTFLGCYRQPKFKLGEYYLVSGKKDVNCYYFAPLLIDKKDKVEDFKKASLAVIEKVIESMVSMGFSSITIPVLEYIPQRKLFKKDTSQSDEFIKQMIELVVDRAEEYNLQVEFYCISDDLTEFVRDVLNEVVLKHNNIAVLQEEKCNNVNNVDNITSNQNTESENGDEDLC